MKKTKSGRRELLNAGYVWLEQFILGLSLSLLASGIVSALMAEDRVFQTVALMVGASCGIVVSFLMRVLPLLTEEAKQ